MAPKALFIAATRQDVGKTTVSLGLVAALKKRMSRVGFIKPVGQQTVKVAEDLAVDKDVVLFKEYFGLTSAWMDMSPVVFPPGFTRSYLDGQVDEKSLTKKIETAYKKIAGDHAFTIVEGTGHVGVGSIINLSNAQVASRLNLEVILIAAGGLGSAFDELALNVTACQQMGIKIRGIILNKVLADKRSMILDYFPKTLERWGIPLLGCIPYHSFLSKWTMNDFEILFHTSLLSGDKYRYHHFQNVRLVAGSLESYLDDPSENELVITPATREDIILGVLQKHLSNKSSQFCVGLILTSRTPPRKYILDQIRRVDIPALYAPPHSYDAMKMITHYSGKLRFEDRPKVENAIRLIEENLDIGALIEGSAQQQGSV